MNVTHERGLLGKLPQNKKKVNYNSIYFGQLVYFQEYRLTNINTILVFTHENGLSIKQFLSTLFLSKQLGYAKIYLKL